MKGALVTGAARRIGAAIASALAADGWHVIAHYSSSAEQAQELAKQIERDGGRVTLLRADLAAADALRTLMGQALAAEPELSLLVNNASLFTYDDAATTSRERLDASFAVNAVAPILLAQAFAAMLPAERDAVVVNILDNRVVAPNPDYFSYGVAKHALLGATRMLALALAPRIRVNGIAPGITLVSGAQSEAAFEAAHKLNPLQRSCSPQEIAATVKFIAASPSMTGAVITLDGGLALANPGRDVAFLEASTK